MAEQARFITRPGETVTAFALGALDARYYPGEVTRGIDTVDYKFVNGFVDVGDLPCRKAVQVEIASRKVELNAGFEIVETNLPGFNRRLDFSGFWHKPTRLSRWVRTRLIPPADSTCPFRLATRGGVHVWVDGALVAAFEPYTRNETRQIELTLPLCASGSDLVLLIEEMAERDTNYFVELTWLGMGDLVATVPGGADQSVLDTLMDLARAVRPEKAAFSDKDELVLVFDRAAERDVHVAAAVSQSVHMRHLPPLFEASVELRAGADRVSLGRLDALPDAYHPLELTFAVGESRIRRAIGFALIRDAVPMRLAGDLAARKQSCLAYLAENGEPRIGRMLARLAADLPLDAASLAALEDTLTAINDRRDCSDFVMVPLLWIYGAHADRLPEAMRTRIVAAILGYRYWMDEPGNDTMWFWSENHVLCFHVSELIAGRLFPDAVFTNSGLTGNKHAALAETRLGRWFDSVEDHGLAEWNSAAYYPIDFIGLFALQHWAGAALKARATTILDRLFTMIALHTMNGVSAGTMGRAYDKELRAGPLTELSPFATVAFGTGWFNQGVAALPMFCASSYAPPEGLADYAAPPKGQIVSAHYVQGYGKAAQLALYKTANMQLSASIDATPGHKGHQQHLVDVQAGGAPMARVWVNHPGEDDPWGSNRPSYWAGNGIMPRVGLYEDCCLVLSDLGAAPRLGFTHAYAPLDAFEAHQAGRDWLVMQSGHGFVLLKATGPITTVTQGPGAGIEHRVQGAKTGWAIMVGDLPAMGLATVARHAASMSLSLSDEPFGLVCARPHRPVLTLDYRDGLGCDGQPVPFPTQSQLPQIVWTSPAPIAAQV